MRLTTTSTSGRAARLVRLAALLLAVTACATREAPAPPAAPAPAPAVRVGPPIELAKHATGSDRVAALIDRDGQAHVLIATPGRVLEVVLHADRVVATRPIPTQAAAPSSIDAAYDSDGRLHALVDDEHWVYADGAWQAGSPPPWRVSGVSVRSPRFVRGAPHLIWSFNVDGDQIGTPMRIDWYAIGNAMGAIIWPWFSHGTRAVLVVQTAAGYGPWVVFEPEGQSDTHLVDAAAEAQGKVHVVYRHSRPGLMASSGASYLTIAEDRLSGADLPPADPARAADPARLRIVSVQGGHWPGRAPAQEAPAQARMNLTTWVCVEPGTGTALVGARWLVRHLLWGEPILWPHHADALVVAPGGGETFHGGFLGEPYDPWFGKGGRPVRYVLLADGRWSAPVDLGAADISAFWGSSWRLIDIAASGDVAYVVWPTPGGIVARRVERVRP